MECPEYKIVVKKFTLLDKETKDHNMKMFQKEVKLMQSFNHPNLIKCIFAVQCTGYLALCMRYFLLGTLYECIHLFNGDYSEYCIIRVACALRYMHNRHVAHLDVRLENIFVDHVFNAVLGDFGTAQELLPEQQTLVTRECGGTSSYSAPEMREAAEDDQLDPYKLDSYSLGVVWWAALMRRYPNDVTDYYSEAAEAHNIPAHSRDWLLQLLEADPRKRPTIVDFLNQVREGGHYRYSLDTF